MNTNLCNVILNIKREDFGNIDHRKAVAAFFDLDEQEVLDLPKREFKTLIIGLINGRLHGKYEAGVEIKTKFFCVPKLLWDRRKDDFEAILKEEIDELKADEERNDDSAVETGSEGEGETENSEEQ